MERFAQMGSGSSLHRDDEGSQSVSQVPPRPAIRLDASLSFLNGSSRAGSARSGPASPVFSPVNASAVTAPPHRDGTAAANMFTSRDMNVDALHASTTGPVKPHRVGQRTESGSPQSASLSLSYSVGSSLCRSQHRSRPGPFDNIAASRSQSGRRKPPTCTSTPSAVVEAMLDTEPTIMTRPSEPRREDAEGRPATATRTSQPQRSRTASPAPRMAVTLPDDFDGAFSHSRSLAVAESIDRTQVDGSAEEHQENEEDKENKTRLAMDEDGRAGQTGSDSDISFFSFSRRDDAVATEVATADQAALRRSAEVDVAEENSNRSRTWSVTPPPRRAFVLSRRCSDAPTTAEDEEKGEGDKEDTETMEDKADLALDETDALTREREHRRGSAQDDGAEVSTVVEDARFSAVLVMHSYHHDVARSGTINSGAEHGVGFAAQVRAGQRQRERPTHRTDAPESEEAEETNRVPVAETTSPPAAHLRHATAALPMGRLRPGVVVEEVVPADAKAVPDIDFPKERIDGVTHQVLHADVHLEKNNQCTAPQEKGLLLPSAATSTTTLRLSDCIDAISGSSRSSMMSPLPRPVNSAFPSASFDAAGGRAGRISPAHAREDDIEDDPVDDVEKSEEIADEREIKKATDFSDMTAALPHDASEQRAAETTKPAVPLTGNVSVTPSEVSENINGPHLSPSPGNVQAEHATEAAEVSAHRLTESAAPRSTTATTSGLEISSLWLVSGSTPTPLRRLRGDVDDSTSAEKQQHNAKEEESEVKEADAEEEEQWIARRQPSPTLNAMSEGDDEEEKGKDKQSVEAAGKAPFADVLDLSSPSFLSNSTLNATFDEEVKPSVRPAVPSPQPVHAQEAASSPAPEGETETNGEEPSCSPEPQPPADVHPTHLTHPTAAAAATTALTASISPVPSMDREERRHRHHQRGPYQPSHSGLKTFTHADHSADQKMRTRAELDFMRPSTPSPTTPMPQRRMSTQPLSTVVSPPPGPHSPSSALSESARVSEEVRELVERAQAEVQRTRASLLATLRGHRSDFHLSELSPTRNGTTATATPSRALHLPTLADSPSSETAATTTATMRASGDLRTAAAALRPQLVAAADAILRRLRGYDERDHGVLPMETVVRVTYFVVMRRRMSVTTWTLRTAEGGIATTPMRASMALSHDNTMRNAAASVRGGGGRGEQTTAYQTPREQRLSRVHSPGKADTHVMPFSLASSDAARNFRAGEKRPRENAQGHDSASPTASVTASLQKTPLRGSTNTIGSSETVVSPSRTLERVMAHQEHRAEEAEYLNFYFTVLEAFKQVFGERYAWRHLGATNATRHDGVVTKRTKTEETTTTRAVKAGRAGIDDDDTVDDDGGRQDISDSLEIENELNEISGPLETVFPRLRQHFAAARTTPTPTMGFALRPPPLDVLVFYRRYADSLREL